MDLPPLVIDIRWCDGKQKQRLLDKRRLDPIPPAKHPRAKISGLEWLTIDAITECQLLPGQQNFAVFKLSSIKNISNGILKSLVFSSQ